MSSGDCAQVLAQLPSTGAEVDYQVAAPAEMRTPNWHRAIIAQPKSADGRMATEAAWLKGEKAPGRKKQNQLDTNRPSHGRTHDAERRRRSSPTPGSTRTRSGRRSAGSRRVLLCERK